MIDDVWRADDLRPFLHGGVRVSRLITTRKSDVLPTDAGKVIVDAMTTEEAVALA